MGVAGSSAYLHGTGGGADGGGGGRDGDRQRPPDLISRNYPSEWGPRGGGFMIMEPYL